MFRWLREHDPVHWHAEPDGGPGFFAVTRYEDVRRVGRDPETFSSVPTILIPDPQPGMNFEIDGHQMMLMMDPPKHTRYRKIVMSAFTPRVLKLFEATIKRHAAEIVDAVCEQGSCDFVNDIAAELPLQAIAEILGVPMEDRKKLFDWTNAMVGECLRPSARPTVLRSSPLALSKAAAVAACSSWSPRTV